MANAKSAILAVRIISDSRDAIGGFDKTGTAAGGLSGKLTGALGPGLLAAGAGVMVIGAAAVSAGKFLYSVGETFDEIADTIRIGTGESGEALDSLVESAKNVGTSIPAAFEDIGPAIADINTRLGLTGPILETVASQYLEAGRMLGEEIDIDATSASFSAFKIEGEGVVAAMDTLFRISQDTGVSMNSLADSVTKQAPALQGLGFSFEQSASLIGVLDKAGMDADKTLAGMGKGLVTLAKAGEEPQAAFQRVTGEIGGLIAAGDKAAAIDMASGLFGTKGAMQFIGAIESGSFSVETLTDTINGSGDSILAVGQETMDAGEKFAILKNRAMVALEPLGKAVFDGVGKALDWVMTLVDGFDFSVFEGAGTTISDLGARFMELVKGFDFSIFANAGTIISDLGAIFMALIDAFDFSVFTEAGTSVGDLGASFMEVVSSLKDLLIPYIQKLTPIVQAVITTVVSLFQPAMDIISGIFKVLGAVLNGDWTAAWDGIKQIAQGVVDFLANLITGAADIYSAVWAFMGDVWGNIWEGIKLAVSIAINAIAVWITGFITGIVTTISNGINAIKQWWTDGWNSILLAIGTFALSIAAKIVGFITGIKTTISNGINAIKQFWSDGWNQMIGGIVGFAVSLVTKVKEIPGKITGALGNFGNLLRQSGVDAIQGLINGIGSMGTAVWTAAQKIASNVVDSIKGFLGIASPSKVAFGLGQFFGDGWIGGMKAKTASAKSAALDLFGIPDLPDLPVLPGSSTGLLSRAAAGITNIYQLTVNGALDAASVARQIEDLLRRNGRRSGPIKIG